MTNAHVAGYTGPRVGWGQQGSSLPSCPKVRDVMSRQLCHCRHCQLSLTLPPTTGWVVMKPVTSDSAGEVYAALLGNKMGIACPHFVVPSYEQQAVRAGLPACPSHAIMVVARACELVCRWPPKPIRRSVPTERYMCQPHGHADPGPAPPSQRPHSRLCHHVLHPRKPS